MLTAGAAAILAATLTGSALRWRPTPIAAATAWTALITWSVIT